MKQPTKKEQLQETRFSSEVAPIMTQLTEICDLYNMPLLIAVQLYTNKTNGARIAAQSVENKNTVIPLRICSKLLRGQARITLESELAFYITIPDENGNYESETHCDDCHTSLENDVPHNYQNFDLPPLNPKNKIIH